MITFEEVIPDQKERDAIIAHMIIQGQYVHGILGYAKYKYGKYVVPQAIKQHLRMPNHGKFVVLEAPDGRKVVRQTFKPGEVLK